jgi:hypothetical protein
MGLKPECWRGARGDLMPDVAISSTKRVHELRAEATRSTQAPFGSLLNHSPAFTRTPDHRPLQVGLAAMCTPRLIHFGACVRQMRPCAIPHGKLSPPAITS